MCNINLFIYCMYYEKIPLKKKGKVYNKITIKDTYKK